jgi:hypothetical protein
MSNNNETTYTDAQYAMLRILAGAFGHGWATEVDMPTTYPIPGAPWTRSFIAECYAAIGRRDRWEPWQYGIGAPAAPGYSGRVGHTTGTGRLRWQVDEGGEVGIVICRPGAEYAAVGDKTERRGLVVLSARIEFGSIVEIRTPDARGNRIPDVYDATWSPDGGPRAEARHGDELLGALGALVGRSDALTALTRSGIVTTDGQISQLRSEALGSSMMPQDIALVALCDRALGDEIRQEDYVTEGGLTGYQRSEISRIARLTVEAARAECAAIIVSSRPAPGWEDRAVVAAQAAGVLPPTA